MDNVRHCRAMSSLFRQYAAFDLVNGWKYLIEAQRWDHLAEAEMASHFKECNSAASKFSEVRTFAAQEGKGLRESR